MYYVISQSTDLRDPGTIVKKFSSLASAQREAHIGSGEFTYKDPETARNWHHTFKTIWELKGRVNKKDKIFNNRGTSCYPRYHADNLAAYIREHGRELTQC